MTNEAKSIAVVGIGNSLLTDDGAGIHTLERFAEGNTDDSVCCLDGGTVGLALLDRLSNLDGLVALDAMILGKQPGAVTVLQGDGDEKYGPQATGGSRSINLMLEPMRRPSSTPNSSDLQW